MNDKNVKRFLFGKKNKRAFNKSWFCFVCPFLCLYFDLFFDSKYDGIGIWYKIIVLVESFITCWICADDISKIDKIDAICVVSKIDKKTYVNKKIRNRALVVFSLFCMLCVIGAYSDYFSLRDICVITLVKLSIFCIFTNDALYIPNNKKYTLEFPFKVYIILCVFIAIYYNIVIHEVGEKTCTNTECLVISLLSVICLIFTLKGIIKRKKMFIKNEYYE